MSGIPAWLRFGMVGVVGFLVDGGLLQALTSLGGWGAIEARGVSFPVAIFATWLLNRKITFVSANVKGEINTEHQTAAGRSFARYVVVSLGGASINFLVYLTLVLGLPVLAKLPIVPLAIASVVAMTFNYLGSKHFAFR